jgi:N6-adenosine-specific RNA methylase IME4
LSDRRFEAAVARAREVVQYAVKYESDRNEPFRKLVEISKGNIKLGRSQRYPVILADPPWRFSLGGHFNRAPENHYPTMPLDEICKLPVSKIATDDAVLFIWTPNAHPAHCMKVIESWAFNYITNLVWVKDRVGLGFYVRSQHELLLIATRGKMPLPNPKSRVSSVINAPRGKHSEKPVEAYEIIERMYPQLPKIELFARGSREGWKCWGNESQRFK